MLRGSCPSAEELLAFTVGESSSGTQVGIAKHLETCRKCQQALRQLDARGDSLVQLVTQLAQEQELCGGTPHEEACRQGIEQLLAAACQAEGVPRAPEAGQHSAQSPPKTIDEYEVLEEIGRGGMGIVYKACHLRLGKLVALKLLSESRLKRPGSVDRFHREMQVVGKLDHPNIVRATDAGDVDGLHFLAMELIEGQSLSDRIKTGPRFSIRETCLLVRQIANGLHYAHEQGIVHRDLKASNVLLDANGMARIVDFGLAASEDMLDSLSFAGTPAYMSPEQARGEGHRVDRRSDVFSLGTLFYELLVGRRPFGGKSTREVCEAILSADPSPPRTQEENTPEEVERICLKALAKHASRRYATAGEMADDLEQWLDSCDDAAEPDKGDSGSSAQIVPKGLRPYDGADAEFFLELLPGPKDRRGFPETIRFWKSRIEGTNGGHAFSVGVLCGPSGSGKSSLVLAGLLPRLGDGVTPVHVVATGNSTESVLAARLRELPGVPQEELALPNLVAGLRRGLSESESGKVLIVLDQFEQWFHGNAEFEESELVHALRQCDGRNVQALLIVRDDFWLATTRLMQALDIPLMESDNLGFIDLFDKRHAAKILLALGSAIGALPSREEELTRDQHRFIERAVKELAEDGRVSPIRLVLFAEMARNSEWDSSALRRLGGMHGMGVAFLEHTFSSRSQSVKYRQHENAVRAILGELSLGYGAQIRERICSRSHLLRISGYETRVADFDEIIDVLDRQLKLITPIDPANLSLECTSHSTTSTAQYYQLTHDFLIPAVREWSILKQKETARGRAELSLRESAALWSERPESRYLPSFWEWASIRLATRRHAWNTNELRMMRRAGRRYVLRTSLAVITLVGALLLGNHFYRESTRKRCLALIDELVTTSADEVDVTMAKILSAHDSILYHLQQRYHAEPDGHARLRCALALAHLGVSQDSCLIDWLQRDESSEFEPIVAALANHRSQNCGRLFALLETEPSPSLRARLAMAMMHLGDSRGASLCLKLAADPIYRTTFIDEFATYEYWPKGLARVLAGTDDTSFRSGLCEALGTVSPGQFSEQEFEQLKGTLLRLQETAADGATHSAATWALRRWQVAVNDSHQSRAPVPGRDWFVNMHGVTMIRIPAGTFTMGRQIPSFGESPPLPPANTIPHEVTLTSDYWVSACEVTHGLYRQFLADENLEELERPKGDQPDTPLRSSHESHPANCVSWFDALLFCNWLSRREGRSPCYRRTGAVQSADHVQEVWDVWDCDFGSDGYRLLTEAEWEYACKAGSETAFSFGGFSERISDFAVFRAQGVDYVETKRPNGWGLFDMHGNVCEWCWDPWPGPTAKPAIDPHGELISRYRPIRGGTWFFRAPAQLRSAECQAHDMPKYRDANIGFRIALSCLPWPTWPRRQGGTSCSPN